MKIALVIMEGREQIVLTPERDIEKDLLGKLKDRNVTIHRGSFYNCQGGWYRQGMDDESTILVLGEPEQEPKA
ncbi:hypothetical protein [Mesorhizobium sp. A556]